MVGRVDRSFEAKMALADGIIERYPATLRVLATTDVAVPDLGATARVDRQIALAREVFAEQADVLRGLAER